MEQFRLVRGQGQLAQPRLISTLEIFEREAGFLKANPRVLAGDRTRGVELREVNLWRIPTPGIDPPDYYRTLFDRDALHNLLVLLDVQKCVRFCALRRHRSHAEFGPEYGLLAFCRFLICARL